MANVPSSSKQQKGLILTFLLSALLPIRSPHLPNTYRHLTRQHCGLHKFLCIKSVNTVSFPFLSLPGFSSPVLTAFQSLTPVSIPKDGVFLPREDSFKLQQFPEYAYGTAKPQKKYEVNFLTKIMIYEEQLNRLCEVSLK